MCFYFAERVRRIFRFFWEKSVRDFNFKRKTLTDSHASGGEQFVDILKGGYIDL